MLYIWLKYVFSIYACDNGVVRFIEYYTIGGSYQ